MYVPVTVVKKLKDFQVQLWFVLEGIGVAMRQQMLLEMIRSERGKRRKK